MARHLLAGILVAAVAVTLASAVAVAAPQSQSEPTAATDSAELEAFVDQFVARQLEEYDAPGAVVAIVRGGEVVLSKGYGYTDGDGRERVDPERDAVRHRFGHEALHRRRCRGRRYERAS